MLPEKTRVYAVDLARGLAVLFMIWIHVLVTNSNSEVQHSIFGMAIGVLGGPLAAPVFMALMGISFYYSRNTDFYTGFIRGLKVILLGYVLNLCRGVLPIFLARLFVPSRAESIPEAVANYGDAFFELDILQFAGLALMVMALIRKLGINKYFLLFFALVISFLSPMLWGLKTSIPVVDHVLDFFWGDKPSAETCIGNLVSFPFFPWFVFVLVGMFVGETMTRSGNLPRTWKIIGMVGFLVLIMSSLVVVPNYEYHLNDYYHPRPGFVIFVIGIILVWLYLCHSATSIIKPNGVFDILFDWSKHVNRIYMIQWVLIMWAADFILGFNQNSFFLTGVTMIIMTVASHFINVLYLRLKKARSLAGARGLEAPVAAH